MAGKGEYLDVQTSCDLCDYKGSGRQVGAHIAHNHYDQLVQEVYDKIVASGRKGLTRQNLEKLTGWTPNRVAGLTKTLERRGIIASNNRRPLRFYDASVKSKTKVGLTRGGGALVTVSSAEVNMPEQHANQFIEQVNRKAMSELAKRHPEEFKQLFLASLIESKINSMTGTELESLLDTTFKS